MPHIKVTPFETAKLDRLVATDPLFDFRAVPHNPNRKTSPIELLGVEMEGERFVLEIHKRQGAYLIKPDKPTRPVSYTHLTLPTKA